VNPFDPKTVLAKHSQHVVLIHFPIALFIAGVAFDFAADFTRKAAFATAAYYNLLLAAVSTLPVVATGLLAWHFALEGAALKGILLWHLLAGIVSTALIAAAARIHQRAHSSGKALPTYRLALEAIAVFVVGLTGHLGGFLSGVNG
jgi:uncharacterized membrane protein